VASEPLEAGDGWTEVAPGTLCRFTAEAVEVLPFAAPEALAAE
jgi:predicted glutamine amidotransferase